MGVAAVAAGGPSMGADFGALFGIGSCKPEQRIDGWRWEAPQLDRRKAKENTTDAGWFGPAKTKRQDAWDSFLQPPSIEEDAQGTKDMIQAEEEAIEQSSLDVHALLSDISHLDHIDRDQLVNVLDFLQSAADEPKAGNLTSFLQWLSGRDLSDAAFSAVVMLVKEKVELATCVDDLAGVLAALLQHAKSTSLCSDIADILNAMRHDELGIVCINTTRELFNATSTIAKDTARTWLACLSLCRPLQVVLEHSKSPTWQSIYAVLAQHISQPSTFTRHFLTLQRLDLARILLRYWGPTPKTQDNASIAMVGYDKTYNFRQPPSDLDINDVLGDLDAMCAARYTRKEERLQPSSSLVDMLDVARRHGLQWEWLCEEIFLILTRSSSATSVQKVSWELRCHPELGLTTRTALWLISYFLKHDKVKFAHSIFQGVPTLSLLHAHQLPIRLAREGTIGSREIWQVLQRQLREDFVDFQDRDPQSPELTLVPEHVDLIHLVAHEFAHSPVLAPRIAYRRVWECYIFLRDRRAPINSLLTRALVHAAVTRPLKALDRPSTEGFRYILNLVERIEGSETAEKLDRAVHRYWTEHVKPLQFRRNVDHAMGVTQDAAKERRAAWHNLRNWAREHRPWLRSTMPKRRTTVGRFNTEKKRKPELPPAPVAIESRADGPALERRPPLGALQYTATGTSLAAASTVYVPFPSFAEEHLKTCLPIHTTATPTVEEIADVEPESISLAPRQGLGYGSPQSNSLAANTTTQHEREAKNTPAILAETSINANFGLAPGQDASRTRSTVILHARSQQIVDDDMPSTKATDDAETDWLDAEDAKQFGCGDTSPVSETKSSGLIQKRRIHKRPSFILKKHNRSKSFPRDAVPTMPIQKAEQTYVRRAPGCDRPAAPLEPSVNAPAAEPATPPAFQLFGKIKRLSVGKKKSRRPGSVQTDYEYLEWRHGQRGRYFLFIESGGQWMPYAQVLSHVKQMRRQAKKTGGVYNQWQLKLLEKWEAAQGEMAKKERGLNGVPRSTLFPR